MDIYIYTITSSRRTEDEERIQTGAEHALCLTMVLGLFCYAPEASALVDSSGYECTGSVEQLLRASSDAVAGQCYRIVNNDDIIALADYVAAGRNTKGVTFYLKADVDMRRNTMERYRYG